MAEDLLEFERIKATYIDFWKRAVDTKGKATRYDFWVPVIVNSVVISVLSPILGTLGVLASIAVCVPGVCVSIRRLNDLGKPWTHILVNLIPFVGSIIFIIWMLQPSKALPAEPSKLSLAESVANNAEAKEENEMKAEIDSANEELDKLLGKSDEAEIEKKIESDVARELDQSLGDDVDDDPLAREIAKAAEK